MAKIEQAAGIGHNAPPADIDALTERLARDHADLAKDVESVARRATAAPVKVETAADLEAVAAIVIEARNLEKRRKKEFTLEKEPYRAAGLAIDKHFNVFRDRLDRIVKALSARADAYQAEQDRKARLAAEEEARKAEAERIRQLEIVERQAERGRENLAAKHAEKADFAEEQAADARRKAEASAADLTRIRTAAGTVSASKAWSAEIEDYQKLDLNQLKLFIDRDAVLKAARAMAKIQKENMNVPGIRTFQEVKSRFRG